MNGDLSRQFRFGEFELDQARRSLKRNGIDLSLNPKAFDLLVELLLASGSIVTKDELLERVWPDQFVEENNLSVQISALRKLLGDGNGGGKYIATISGKGYAFVAPLENADEEFIIEHRTIERILIERDDLDNHSEQLALTGKSSNFRPMVVAVILLCVVATIFGVIFWRQVSARSGFAPAAFTERKLTTSGRVNIAIVSPDGKMFAYSVREADTQHSSIRIGQTNGSSDLEILPTRAELYDPIAFSNDSQYLYYVDYKPRQFENATFYKMPAIGGVPQKLFAGINIYPALSPDEKKLAIVRTDRENKTSTLVVAHLDGSGESILVTRPIDAPIRAQTLAWSKDGSMIAFGAKKEGEGFSEIFVTDTATGNLQQLTAGKIQRIFRLGWLSDGSGLIGITSPVERSWGKIWHIRYPDGELSEITRDHKQYVSVLSLTADARSLLSVEVSSESNIWTSPADSLADITQITFGGLGRQDGWGGLAIAADGNIIFTSKKDLRASLWTIDSGGQNAKQLTPWDALDANPSVSSDGNYVIFDSDRSGRSEIWRVRADGSELTQITADGENSDPSFLSDGQSILYRHGGVEASSLRRISLFGNNMAVISDAGGSSPRVSPNGEFVACGRTIEGKDILAVLSTSTGEQVRQFPLPQTFNLNSGAIRWSPDGRFICYRDWSNGIWKQNIEGGEPERIVNLPDEKFYQYVWSADSKQFALTRGRELRDVVILDRQ
ncbi:MAG TPA: winged helix-turn-helix domain-containing protein [Pyrinomonadaceae bacterium]|nr:PD40 domain-containing protein [Chloracidobacterium sp.]MBP9936237.1 PD40 domain-containing protein [Pyrinomonadaceae bacterium]MBK7802200.1 PD40 domain-containing protein [Chloracidobacterium sp.]MBL0239745.1 PD40 domain-containing protein [Chloracidobacterium sp.]HQX56158.1 winged helix-turn-helix domain-containing protein [Pyrinomonadaceae bacterium]